jgi:uncharacterized OB-fold protein
MSDASAASGETLRAPHRLEYTYKRSLGDVLGRFFTSLRDGKIEGLKTRDGRVLVPPAEYDPNTGAATTDEWVEVGPGGVVESWTWISQPRASHPLDHPFAFALVKLDAADTALLHVVDTGDEGAMKTGMRVRAKFADETIGQIQDIACFVPEDAS